MYKMNIKNAQSKAINGFLFHWSKPQSDSPYLLFIPGAWHGAWCFEHYFTYFHERGYNVASVDLPNRGGMPAGDNFNTLNIAHIAQTIKHAINSIDAIKIIVAVGHSMGALMAGQLASQSDYVRGLVLLAPSPNAQIQGAKKMPLVNPNTVVYMQDYHQTSLKFWPHITDKNEQKRLFFTLNGESPHLINERFGLTVHIPWQRGKCPALVLEAELENPEIHPPQQYRNVAHFYQPEYHLINGVAHCLMLGDTYKHSAVHIENWLNAKGIASLKD